MLKGGENITKVDDIELSFKTTLDEIEMIAIAQSWAKRKKAESS